jgi:hypothetical protein
MQGQFTEIRHISLPKGGILEVQLSPEMFGRIREHFGLFPGDVVDDDHVRMFFWNAVNNAVDKVEREVNDGRGSELNC